MGLQGKKVKMMMRGRPSAFFFEFERMDGWTGLDFKFRVRLVVLSSP